MPDVRSLRLLTLLDHGTRWQELLDSFLIAFEAPDPACLVLGVPAEIDAEAIAEQLETTIVDWGYDLADIPDIELAAYGPGEEEALRLTCDHEVVGEAPEPTELRRLAGSPTLASPPLVSIVILTSDQLSLTRRCLESVRRHTRLPHEILVIDNASTDGTADFLGTQPWVRTLSSGEHLGFGQGCNRGIAAARGRHIVLLDCDTLVTAGWLDRLLDELQSQPEVGIVEPVSNDPTAPLAGSGMLIRREVLDRIGGLDTRYDNKQVAIRDFAQRARSAGYALRHGDGTFSRPLSTPFDPACHFQALPTPAAYTGRERMTSIVILGFNQLAYTQICIESIQKFTNDEPYELVLIDNGSTDGTTGYFQDLAVRHRNVQVVLNSENLGFAGGCNQGIAAAHGDRILLLNNDTLVTEGWLGRLCSKLEADPSIGIVGPVSNYVNGPQLIKDVPYGYDLAEITAFSEQWARDNAGQGFWMDKIVGFCMLIPRAVIDRIGGFDTRFGIGNYEDDDFCLRARVAGFRIWVSRDVFIHHFGSRTFMVLGDNAGYRASMDAGWELFKEKWHLPAELNRGPDYGAEHLVQQRFDPERHICPIADSRPS